MGLSDFRNATINIPVRLDKVRHLLDDAACSCTCIRLSPESLASSCTCHYQLISPVNHAALQELYRQTVALLVRLRDLGELGDGLPEHGAAVP